MHRSPPSPDGKRNKESELIADAQNFIVSMQHQEKSGYGVSAVAKGVDGDELETAEVLKKKKKLEAKAIGRKKVAERIQMVAKEAAKEAEIPQVGLPRTELYQSQVVHVGSLSNYSSLLSLCARRPPPKRS